MFLNRLSWHLRQSIFKRTKNNLFHQELHTSKMTLQLSDELRNRKEKQLDHLFDGTDWNVYENNILNLGVGAPGPDLLQNCYKIFQEATSHRMKKESNGDGFLFQYGPTIGTYEIRTELSKYLCEAYMHRVYGEDIVVTTGATQGLHLVLSTLIDLNGCIFVDEVTYMLALEVFQQFSNLKVIPVRLTDAGVDVEHLEALLKENRFKSQTKMFWGLYYAIPTFHNPTGLLFSEDICRSLVNLARKYDILIACDDVYNVVHLSEESPKRLYSYDNIEDSDYKGHVISNGSFSKIIAPGVRLGWLEAPPRCHKLLADCGILQSGGCVNQYTSGIMASLFQLGHAQSHIKFMSNSYNERMIAACEVLKTSLSSSCSFIEPKGGYFIWIKLPETIDANKLLKYCMETHKVFFIVGNRFSIENKFKNCLRISIAFHQKDQLEHGVRNICRAIEEYLK